MFYKLQKIKLKYCSFLHLIPPQPHIPISVRNSRRSVDLVSLGYLGVLSLPLLLLLLLLFIVIAPFKSIYNHKLC